MIAAPELSEELFKLSGWEGDYTLGYLIRKLRPFETLEFTPVTNGLNIYWELDDRQAFNKVGGSPEDAACGLAIELFNQGVLTR